MTDAGALNAGHAGNVPFHVILDGEIFQTQPPGGIARTYIQIMPLMCGIAPEITWQFLIPLGKAAYFPRSANVRALPQLPTMPFGYHHPWRRLSQKVNRWTRALGCRSDAIWHSTYYTDPPAGRFVRVASVYDMIYEQEFGKLHPAHAVVARTADHVICSTECVARQFSDVFGYPRNQISVIPLAAADIFIGEARIHTCFLRRDRPYFLYVGGRTNAYKNFDLLLHAFAASRVAKGHDLVLVGPRLRPEEAGHAELLGIRDRVFSVGQVPDLALRELYLNAVALVYPSRFEGFGIPLLEAAACHCQIVASAIPSTVEVVGSYPHLFDPDSMESAVAALESAVEHRRTEEERRLMAEQVARRFSWSRTARMHLDVYRSIAAHRH